MYLKRLLDRLPRGTRAYILFSLGLISICASSIYILTHSRPPIDFDVSAIQNQDSPDPLIFDTKLEDTVAKAGGLKKTDPGTCQIPHDQIDPFDQSILKYVDHPRKVTCRRIQPDLVIVGEDGVIRLNQKSILELKNGGNISCYYQYFDRGHTDHDIIYEEKILLIGETSMVKEFVKVSCYQGRNTTQIFTNIFSHPTPLPNLAPWPLSLDGSDMNVLILTLESASASMVHRHLPKTLQYLTNTGAIQFKNYLKVGENTLPNLAALFTGQRARKEQDDMPGELPEPTSSGFYDHWPMIWKKYKQKGYETGYVEDYAHIGTFHYSARGFKEKPVDRWYFPFWYAQGLQKSVVSKSSRFCFGNDPMYKIFTDILHRLLQNAQGKRQFIFSIFSDLSHDFTSDLERADDTWVDFLETLDSKGILNRTLIIFLGDHGPRFSTHRRTVAGFAEERLPFLALRMPPFLYGKFPNLQKTIQDNSDRLVSMYDLHQTLLDTLNQEYDSATLEWSTRGHSLFRPMPIQRTCGQAGVPDRYCLCRGYIVQPLEHHLAKPAAQIVLTEVRKMVQNYKHKCAKWKMDKLLYFIQIPWPGEIVNETETYFVAFKAQPLDGMFEGVVVRNLNDDSLRFKEGTLERINAFGGEGKCIEKWRLWKYCVCKNQGID